MGSSGENWSLDHGIKGESFATPLEGVRLERGDHVIALSNNCGIVNERKFCSCKFLFRVLQGMI